MPLVVEDDADLQFWEQDDATDVVMLYLESFGNPRRFGRIARRVAAAKPVIAVKSGRAAGRPGGGSQTDALVTPAHTSVDALFRDAGVIRTDTLGEMFDLAALLTRQPAPRGDRVAIVTNAGGLGIQCADACAAAGLEIAALGARAQLALVAALPVGSTVERMIDMTAEATAAHYEGVIAAAVADPAVDAVIALFARPLGTRAADVADALEQAAAGRDVPVVGVFMGAAEAARPAAVPRFAAPEEAVRALALRIGALAAAHPEVAELDCNPVVAAPSGALVVDARARLEPPPPRAPYAAVGRF